MFWWQQQFLNSEPCIWGSKEKLLSAGGSNISHFSLNTQKDNTLVIISPFWTYRALSNFTLCPVAALFCAQWISWRVRAPLPSTAHSGCRPVPSLPYPELPGWLECTWCSGTPAQAALLALPALLFLSWPQRSGAHHAEGLCLTQLSA